jgi:hypothetical protein
VREWLIRLAHDFGDVFGRESIRLLYTLILLDFYQKSMHYKLANLHEPYS